MIVRRARSCARCPRGSGPARHLTTVVVGSHHDRLMIVHHLLKRLPSKNEFVLIRHAAACTAAAQPPPGRARRRLPPGHGSVARSAQCPQIIQSAGAAAVRHRNDVVLSAAPRAPSQRSARWSGTYKGQPSSPQPASQGVAPPATPRPARVCASPPRSRSSAEASPAPRRRAPRRALPAAAAPPAPPAESRRAAPHAARPSGAPPAAWAGRRLARRGARLRLREGKRRAGGEGEEAALGRHFSHPGHAPRLQARGGQRALPRAGAPTGFARLRSRLSRAALRAASQPLRGGEAGAQRRGAWRWRGLCLLPPRRAREAGSPGRSKRRRRRRA